MDNQMTYEIESFFHKDTNTFSYLLIDKRSQTAAIVDPVLGFDSVTGKISTESADRIVDWMSERGVKLECVFETHLHADHLSGAHYLRERLGVKVGIGSRVIKVQRNFAIVFNSQSGPGEATDQFDLLFEDEEEFCLGSTKIQVLHTPGHTPACVTYLLDGAAFVGDTLFMPDFGTARTDFPGGDAEQLYRSLQRILRPPRETKIFFAHDYLPNGRDTYECCSKVAKQLHENIDLAGKSKEEFVALRESRDRKLSAPKLLLPSIQVNICAGKLPEPESNQRRYLKIPLQLPD